ncbi:hypothetical protein NicSoilB4_07180 [Arthrobacter sp. NicSoilB4]|uniref:class F sortase n=1 Tax=Arthrobacter sp. NicSoilB4 TaxID=2830997 RepID=UPI001CC68FAF|nr:class F sortase [Arthrobacter sp. NicSoilB4]BCW65955.1 hypothetical protein NicSoilB4_07180 [Arthrobacter sp. NicSoilB4]
MPFRHSTARHSLARGATTAKHQTWNRGDLLILACGLAAFLVLAYLSGQGTPARSDLAASLPAAPALVAPASPSPGPLETAAVAPGKVAAGSAAQAAPAPPPALPLAAAPVRIVYPSAGFDVVVHSLDPSPAEIEAQTIVPPVSLDGYWVTNFGVPGAGSTNTTYIMGHSWEGRDAPFNRLSSAAAPGDIFEVTTAAGQIRYRVDSISTENKSSLKDNPIWQVVPNRVVIISCYTEDLFGKNVVIVASPFPEPGP